MKRTAFARQGGTLQRLPFCPRNESQPLCNSNQQIPTNYPFFLQLPCDEINGLTNQNQRRRFFFIQNANSDLLISVSNASVCAPVAPRLGSASMNPSCLGVHQNKLFVNENAILLPLKPGLLKFD